jgi:branched-chain amino acid transport system substrate-binding protein
VTHRHRGRRSALAIVAALGLVAAACSEDDGGSDAPSTEAPSTDAPTTDAPTETEAPTTEAPAGELPVSQTTIDTALAYTGGPGGATSGDPIKIGYVNADEGTPSWPEASFGIDAGVWLANNFLGGVGGRPIELVKCNVAKEEDGQSCAQQMLADADIQAVITGAYTFGNQPLLDTLNGQKPVFIGNPVTTPEFLATDGIAYTPGVPGVIGGLAVFAAKFLGEIEGREIGKVAAVYNDNAAGVASFESFIKPIISGFGLEVTGVSVPDTAGPTEMATAIQAAGADTADVFIPLVQVQGCIGIYEALKTLEIDTAVVTTGLCFGVPMQDHLAQVGAEGNLPDGWYFGGYGFAYEIPGDPSTDAYIDAALAWGRENGDDSPNYTGFGGPTFGTLLTVLKFMNAGATDSAALREAGKAFTGPMWAVAGEMTCGGSPIFPSLCGNEIGIQQQQGTSYVSIMDGYNGKAINPNKELAAG